MFETILSPKKAERRPWELFFVGLFYASFAMLLANFMFLNSQVFSNYLGVLTILFTVMLSLPFMYFTIKFEEEKDIINRKEKFLIKEHGKALLAFMYLFLGFLVAFSLAYIILPQSIVSQNFDMQVRQYCAINVPGNVEDCVTQFLGITGKASSITTSATSWGRVMTIFENNIYVLIFCILFSLVFGVGAIFILTWNASVIAAAIGIFSESNLSNLPAALVRYMFHGLPEITAYFYAGLAGGIVSIAVVRHHFKGKRFWHILQDSVDMTILAVIILFVAALIEVFITPALF